MTKKKSIAICGAGIAGVATAYYLLQKSKDLEVLLIDKNQPLGFTTSKSGENFRDYWPQPFMQRFVGHSIDLMQALRKTHGTASFEMVFSGYDFISHHRETPIFGSTDESSSDVNMKVITDPLTLRNRYPYLDRTIQKVVTITKAGRLDVYALGNLLLRESKLKGMRFHQGEIMAVEQKSSGFEIMLDSQGVLEVDQLVLAAGPFLNRLAAMVGLKFPIINTLQHKFIIPDPKKIIPPDMPFTIYADAQTLDWSAEEAQFFESEEKYHWMLQRFPAGLHIKPDSGGIKMGWAIQRGDEIPSWETTKLEFFPQVVLKGASRFIPALREYEAQIPSPLITYSGYYTRTKENLPLIGPTEKQGVFVVGALAGYGTMSGCAAGELCAGHILGESLLPDYAAYFVPQRYADPEIMKEIESTDGDGQL